jgi:hypothetical protein
MKTQLEQFRQQLYESFPGRSDALMDLLDALSSHTTARSVVELSLSPLFRQGYGSVYTAIHRFFPEDPCQALAWQPEAYEQKLTHLVASYLPPPQQREFFVFGLDATPAPRPFAQTLEDRGFVHQPTPVKGNKPVAIGHQYSALVAFPQKGCPTDPPWVVPLSMRRVETQRTATSVGAQQMKDLLADETLPFHSQLCVEVVDSAYSGVPFLGRMTDCDNLVTLARLRGNRTLYRQAKPLKRPRPQGHPTWYGSAFNLQDPKTWGVPDQKAKTVWTTRKGRTLTVHIQAWHDLLMSGTFSYPMHRHPFTLIRCTVTDEDGKQVFRRPLWLLAMGKRRLEISPSKAWQAYGQRFDMEHFFRFGKQRLLLGAYQTPLVDHEQNWWRIVCLAYVQLWLARSLAQTMPRPWEPYRSIPPAGVASPTTAQRDFSRIIRQIGTPADAPKLRGYSPGRAKGQRQSRRERQPVVKKGPARPQKVQLLA